ncbi:MAG TPA: hypothetical protein ENN23_08955 [Deltaproteobacteria bacterium]|nr:hypothetical protein [Deltaproteobacteria bacterium]
MKKIIIVLCLVFLVAVVAYAQGPKGTRSVTGEIVEMTAEKIVIDRGKTQWLIERNAGTNITGNVKVGSRVKVDYKMVATDVKEVTAKKPATKKKK